MEVKEDETKIRKKLPEWVKCMHCGKPPSEHDWLIEIVPHSTALAHQSCARDRGFIAGIDGLKGE